MDLWRISDHRDLRGEGGRRYSARWHTAASPIVYLAASPAGALLEVLVHLELQERNLPHRYTLLQIAVPSALHIRALRIPKGDAWKSDITITRSIGDRWLRSNSSALARVPSVVLPNTANYLLNPLHPDAASIRIEAATSAILDSRLLRR